MSPKQRKRTFPAQKKVPFLVLMYNTQGLGESFFPALGVFSVLLSVPISFLIPAKKKKNRALGVFSVLLSSFLIPAFLFSRKHEYSATAQIRNARERYVFVFSVSKIACGWVEYF